MIRARAHSAFLIALGLLRAEPGRFGISNLDVKDLPTPLDESIRRLVFSLTPTAREKLRELVAWVLEYDQEKEKRR